MEISSAAYFITAPPSINWPQTA